MVPEYPNNPPVQPRDRNWGTNWFPFWNREEREWRRYMQAQIERAIAEIAETKDIVKAIQDGFALQAQQIENLKKLIEELKARGDVVAVEDLEALGRATDELDETNKTLASAIPANTEPSANG